MKEVIQTAYTIGIGCCFILAIMLLMGDNGAGAKVCSLILGATSVIAWNRISRQIEQEDNTDNW